MCRMMRRLLVVLAIALGFPSSASANATAMVSLMNCSGDLTVSLLDAASFSCTGSLSLSGGAIFAESRVEISADGALWLDNLSIAAPFVELVSLDRIAIGQGVIINASSSTGGAVTIRSGGNISLVDSAPWPNRFSAGGSISLGLGEHGARIPLPGGDVLIAIGQPIAAGAGVFDGVIVSSIPEPEPYAMLLAGIGLVGLVARRRD